MSRTESGLVWNKRTARDTHLIALRGMKIGPAFPERAPEGPKQSRKAGRGGKDTKAPWSKAPRVNRRGAVTVSCLSCPWTATRSTWRPAKARLAAHVVTEHARIAA